MAAGVELPLNKGSDDKMIERAFDFSRYGLMLSVDLFQFFTPIKCLDTAHFKVVYFKKQS